MTDPERRRSNSPQRETRATVDAKAARPLRCSRRVVAVLIEQPDPVGARWQAALQLLLDAGHEERARTS